jgi:hypothetical protein
MLAIGAISAQGTPTKKNDVTSGTAPKSGTVASPTTTTSKATPTNRPGSTSSTAVTAGGSGPIKGGNAGSTSVQGPKTTPAVQAAPAKGSTAPASTSSNSNPSKK